MSIEIVFSRSVDLGGGAVIRLVDCNGPMALDPADVPALMTADWGCSDFVAVDPQPGQLAAWIVRDGDGRMGTVSVLPADGAS